MSVRYETFLGLSAAFLQEAQENRSPNGHVCACPGNDCIESLSVKKRNCMKPMRHIGIETSINTPACCMDIERSSIDALFMDCIQMPAIGGKIGHGSNKVNNKISRGLVGVIG